MAGGIIVVAAAIPFVLLCACLKRSNVPLQDEKAENEVVELQGKPAVTYADNVGFIADEEAGQFIDDAVDVVKANQAAISIAGAGRGLSVVVALNEESSHSSPTYENDVTPTMNNIPIT